MVLRKLSLHAFLLALSFVVAADRQVFAQYDFENSDVIIADDFEDAFLEEPSAPNYVDYDVIPAQAQAQGARRRTTASPAALAGTGQRTPQGFGVQLARAPKMMGDFFNLPGQQATVGELFTNNGQHEGLAVHQAIGSGSAFANDNIAIITTDPGTQKVVFLGGPGGITPGTFFEPSIPAAELQNPQTGLRLDGDNVNFYTAVLDGNTADVFDNPNDTNPSIPDAPVYKMFLVSQVALGGPNPGDLVGRVRIQDNNNAMPQNRIFIDYNFFHNVPFTANGIDVNRVTPGIEKTFLQGMGSIEVRVPMAVTYNSTQFLAVGPDSSEPEFGNVAIIPKILLTSNEEHALAGGIAVALPTADDIRVFGQSGEQILNVENESVHLIPFLGYLYTPEHSDCFVQAFVTLDVDLNGNAVTADTIGNGSLAQIGEWNDQTLASGSATFGKYLYQNYSQNSTVKSFSLISEAHYTGTANDADVLASGPFILGNPDYDLALLNATFGGHLRLKDSTVTTGYTVPLTSSDRIFDGEFRLFINQFF
jgi:hypothetical protein